MQMIDSAFQNELLKQIDQLPSDLQKQVLDYAKNLKSSPPQGTPGSELLRLAGTISDDDAQEMMKAIEEGCEQIDYDEW
jgi:hypothetical protein